MKKYRFLLQILNVLLLGTFVFAVTGISNLGIYALLSPIYMVIFMTIIILGFITSVQQIREGRKEKKKYSLWEKMLIAIPILNFTMVVFPFVFKN